MEGDPAKMSEEMAEVIGTDVSDLEKQMAEELLPCWKNCDLDCNLCTRHIIYCKGCNYLKERGRITFQPALLVDPRSHRK